LDGDYADECIKAYANKAISNFNLNISLAEIPMLSVQFVCHTTIQQHSITCNLNDQTLQGGTVWINASLAEKESNSTPTLHLTIATYNTRT